MFVFVYFKAINLIIPLKYVGGLDPCRPIFHQQRSLYLSKPPRHSQSSIILHASLAQNHTAGFTKTYAENSLLSIRTINHKTKRTIKWQCMVESQHHELNTTHGHSVLLQGQMQCNGIQ